jgi:hypothetical protein
VLDGVLPALVPVQRGDEQWVRTLVAAEHPLDDTPPGGRLETVARPHRPERLLEEAAGIRVHGESGGGGGAHGGCAHDRPGPGPGRSPASGQRGEAEREVGCRRTGARGHLARSGRSIAQGILISEHGESF